MSNDNREISSPCISECQLNEESICLGCYRTIDDIVTWRALDNSARLKAIEAAKQRQLKDQ